MKIFLLQRRDAARIEEAQSMVVVATDELSARGIASTRKHDGSPRGVGFGDEGGDDWASTIATDCQEVGSANNPGLYSRIVCTSFYFG